MDLPINDKDLATIVSALALGGDARLYHLLKEAHQEFQKGTLVLSEMNVTLHRHHIKLFMMQLSI